MFRPVFMSMTLVLFSSLSSAHALEVYGNGANRSQTGSTSTSFGLINDLGFASPFTTGNSTEANRLIGGAFVLINSITNPTTIDLRIYADGGSNAGPSGTPVVSKSFTVSPGAGAAWTYIGFTTPVQLAANSNYYLSIVRTSGNSFEFDWYQPETAKTYGDLGSNSGFALTTPGTQNVYQTLNGGSTWDITGLVTSNAFGFQIVPEPSTHALAGIAALALGIVVRRKTPVPA